MNPRNQKEIEELLAKDGSVEPPPDLLPKLKMEIPDRFQADAAVPVRDPRHPRSYLRVAALLHRSRPGSLARTGGRRRASRSSP